MYIWNFIRNNTLASNWALINYFVIYIIFSRLPKGNKRFIQNKFCINLFINKYLQKICAMLGHTYLIRSIFNGAAWA